MSNSTNYMLPHSYKNARKRFDTKLPKLDDSGKPVINNGKLVTVWQNSVDENKKPIYTKDILITFKFVKGQVVPPTLSKSMMSTLIKDAKDCGKTLLTEDNTSYVLNRTFDPQQLDSPDSDDTIDVVTAKQRPAIQPILSGITSW